MKWIDQLMHNLVVIHIVKFNSYILALQNIKFDDDDDWNQEEEVRKFPSIHMDVTLDIL